MRRSISIILLLLVIALHSANASDQNEETIFGQIRKGDIDAVVRMLKWNPELIEQREADYVDDHNKPNTQNLTPLLLAAEFGHLEIVKYLVEKNASLAAKEGLPDESNALINSFEHDNFEVAKYLIPKYHEQGLINDPDKYVQTPLYWAVAKKQKELVRMLIGNGADVNTPCVFWKKSEPNEDETIEGEINEDENDADETAENQTNDDENDGWIEVHSPIQMAVRPNDDHFNENEYEITEMLLDAKADINERYVDYPVDLKLHAKNNASHDLRNVLSEMIENLVDSSDVNEHTHVIRTIASMFARGLEDQENYIGNLILPICSYQKTIFDGIVEEVFKIILKRSGVADDSKEKAQFEENAQNIVEKFYAKFDLTNKEPVEEDWEIDYSEKSWMTQTSKMTESFNEVIQGLRSLKK